MDQELCPICKSELTELVEVDGQQWKQCNHQGCSGRVSTAKYFFKPGEGLQPKEKGSKSPAPDKDDNDGDGDDPEDAEEASA